MSNFRAVATVTATIQRNLQAVVQTDVAGATVTTVRPAEGENTNLPLTGVNVYLYQVSPNAHSRNADLPTRRTNGDLAQRPQAAIDLHYLFSFYGSDLELEPQRLLGSTVAFLHSQPLLTRAQIEAAVGDATKPFLANSDLAAQIDLIRFAPLGLSLEEVSRLWSVFFQVRYVLSVAYQASVVLVERALTTHPALPTRGFSLAAATMRLPAVARVLAGEGESTPITPGSTVLVEGEGLRAQVMRVEIDGAGVGTVDVRPDRIELTLAEDLPAGAHSLRVRHGVPVGSAGAAPLAFSSNMAAFVLQPVISRTDGVYDIAVANVQGEGPALRSATVVIGAQPVIGTKQTVTLEMITATGVAHTFLAQPRVGDTNQVTFVVEGVVAGAYLCRIRVDGAESPLEVDGNGVPNAPEMTVP
jgi:hypothetical protein